MMPLMQPSILFALSATAAQFAHMELVVHQDPQDPFHWAAPQLGRSQLVLHLWIMFYQVQDLMLVLAGLHTVLVRPIFQSLLIFLQGDSPFWSVHFPTQFGIIGKLCQCTLDPILQTTYQSLKPHQAQYWSLGNQLVAGCQFEKDLFTTILWVQPGRQIPTHCTDHLSRASHISCYRRRVWETESKALEKSR